jgi:hypothetical protein
MGRTIYNLAAALAVTAAGCGGAISGQSGPGDTAGTEAGSGSGSADSGQIGTFSDSGFGGDSEGDAGPLDAEPGSDFPQDATFDVAPSPVGLAGFAFIVNGAPLAPMQCPDAKWEFPWPSGEASGNRYPPTPGIHSVVIVNTGTLPMPYLAQSVWNPGGGHAVPGGGTGASYQLSGVLQPEHYVDITSVYVGGIVALAGSAEPFSNLDAGMYASDEGAVQWPPGVAGSQGSPTMYVAEIEVPSSQSTCMPTNVVW